MSVLSNATSEDLKNQVAPNTASLATSDHRDMYRKMRRKGQCICAAINSLRTSDFNVVTHQNQMLLLTSQEMPRHTSCQSRHAQYGSRDHEDQEVMRSRDQEIIQTNEYENSRQRYVIVITSYEGQLEET